MFVLTIISLLLLTAYGCLIGWYHRVWVKMPPTAPSTASVRTRITVLIPARNEEQNILTCLKSLTLQTYPQHLLEVIVIDDHSTDATAAVVGQFPAPFSLRCLDLSQYPAPAGAFKKFAIEKGVAAASGTLIVTTDADCWFHRDWLTRIAAFYETTGAKFIAAPVCIDQQVPGLPILSGHRRWHTFRPHGTGLYLLQTLDFITLQGITAASVHKRAHSMCNGANLAYEKQAFSDVDGFTDIDHLPSGDDMLLMHKIYKRYPDKVFFLKDRNAIVSTRPAASWKAFFHQRIRWASKAAIYDDRRIFWVLLWVYLTNLLFPILLVAACWNRWYLWIALLLATLKTMVEYPFVRSVAAFFGQQRLMVFFPALQPLHIAYTLVVGWLGQFGTYRWKDRKIEK